MIILNRIRFAEEIRDASELNLPDNPEIKKGELEMAISLINQLSSKFDVTGYKDTYTEQLLALIEAKSKGEKVTSPKMRVVHSAKEDLMSQLKASLGAAPAKKKKAS